MENGTYRTNGTYKTKGAESLLHPALFPGGISKNLPSGQKCIGQEKTAINFAPGSTISQKVVFGRPQKTIRNKERAIFGHPPGGRWMWWRVETQGRGSQRLEVGVILFWRVMIGS